MRSCLKRLVFRQITLFNISVFLYLGSVKSTGKHAEHTTIASGHLNIRELNHDRLHFARRTTSHLTSDHHNKSILSKACHAAHISEQRL
ncbi:hypothetical protein F4860DRAFT_139600 [Xylaria cubensis]|nr:hypothetical protein F4860DRAFT_139600 [Xylaria cubensis]